MEVLQQVRSNLQSEAGLAGSCRPGEGDERHVRLAKESRHARRFLLSADEGRGLAGEVVGEGIEGLERRELRGQAWCEQLEDVLGAEEVFEAVLAQVSKAD